MMFLKLFVANLKMLVRDRQSLFFAILLPVGLTLWLGFMLRSDIRPIELVVARTGSDPAAVDLERDLRQDEQFTVTLVGSEGEARRAFDRGRVDGALLIPDLSTGGTVTLIFDEKEARNLHRLSGSLGTFVQTYNLRAASAPEKVRLETVGLRAARRLGSFDYILPGVMIFTVIFSTVVGVATSVAKNREMRLFKRLQASPLHPGTYAMAEVAARVVVAMVQTAVVLALGIFQFDMTVVGQIVWVFVLVAVGTFTFLSLGVVVGSRARSTEAASSLAMIITLPLIFLSGVFGADFLTADVARIGSLLPLTPIVDSLRGVILDGAGPLADPRAVALTAGWLVLLAGLAALTFKFSDLPPIRV